MSAPSLAELMMNAGRSLLDGMQVTLPAIVERYDADKQCVDATPTIKHPRRKEDGTVVYESLPVVTSCPVLFPGSGPYRITWPIEVGSVVVLHFTSASLGQWLTLGGIQEPGDGRRHDGTSAFAVPGGHSFGGSTAPGTTAPTSEMVVHAPGGMRLGGPAASDRVAGQSDLEDLYDIVVSLVMADTSGTMALLKEAMSSAGWPNCSTAVRKP